MSTFNYLGHICTYIHLWNVSFKIVRWLVDSLVGFIWLLAASLFAISFYFGLRHYCVREIHTNVSSSFVGKKVIFFVQNKYITFSDMMKFLCSIMNVFMFIVSKTMRVISKYLFVKHFPQIFNRLCNLLIVRTVPGTVFQDCRPNK